MSRRIKRPLSKGDRPGKARPPRKFRDDDRAPASRPPGRRPGGKPPRTFEKRREEPVKRQPAFAAEPEKPKAELPALPIKVQTVVVTADENNMRVDRFLEARFPGLSFSHTQRIVRKGELRVNGKRADSKDRIEEGQSIRIPPLKLDTPKEVGALSEAASKTLQ